MEANNQSMDSNALNANDASASDVNAANADNQSSSGSTHGRIDPAWRHISLNIKNGKLVYTCLFCLNKYKG